MFLLRPLLLTFSTLLATATAFGHPPEPGQSGHSHAPSPTPTDSLPVLGHGDAKYEVDLNWAKVTPDQAPVINSHAIEEGRDGLLYLVTDHPENAFLVFEKDGTFVRSFGKGLYGGHGLALFERDGEELVIHVDCGWHFEAEGWKATNLQGRVTILRKDGEIVKSLPTPTELGIAAPGAENFKPCDVAVTPDGNILIADGYGSNYIYEMTSEGELVNFWGGPGEKGEGELKNAHGISIDLSNPDKPLVWVPSRSENKIKAFTLDGDYVDTLELPGLFAGQLCFRDDKIYTAVCWSVNPETGKKEKESGFLVIIDRESKQIISAPGGSEPKYVDGQLQPVFQTSKTFLHGHDLYVDSDGAIYLGEWNANRRYPTKLTPAK